jgi:hypothetical protein
MVTGVWLSVIETIDKYLIGNPIGKCLALEMLPVMFTGCTLKWDTHVFIS